MKRRSRWTRACHALVSIADFVALFVLELTAVVVAGAWLGPVAALGLALGLPPLTFALVAQRGRPQAPLDATHALGASLMAGGAATLLSLATLDAVVGAAFQGQPLWSVATRHDLFGALVLLPGALLAGWTLAFHHGARHAPRRAAVQHMLWTLTMLAVGTLATTAALSGADTATRACCQPTWLPGDSGLAASALVAAWCAPAWLLWWRREQP